ncbi:unnamed protein product [Haemonchus placei]|uniref:SRR1 domain-containing protein n=1 Tax=Haemonchus placei TaxID=6290 RepID=A0A0N4WAU8_HAEPC|nr:unnamed protein product [Haemonchus placei]
MEDDGFKLVRSRRKCSRLKKTAVKSVDRIEGSGNDIEAAMERADSKIEESGLGSWIINSIRLFLDNRRVLRVYLIGNGHFDAPWEPGAHQLALIRRICRAFDAEMIFQEPCISAAEQKWLSLQEGIVIRDKPDVCFDIIGTDHGCIGIAVLLHGVHSLLNDFLAFNWSSNLHEILILCNDYRDIDLIGGTAETNAEFPVLNFYREHARFVAFPEYSPNPQFFHNSSLAYLVTGTSLPELTSIDC